MANVTAGQEASLRLFYALWPDDAMRERLMRLQTLTTGRHTHYDNLHLTLAFLGTQPPDLLPLLGAILERLPRDEIVLKIERLGYFTHRRIAWAGPRTTPTNLRQLVRVLHAELIQCGVRYTQDAAFRPHITLARNAKVPPAFACAPFACAPFDWHADRIALVQSAMRHDNVRYEVLMEHTLR